MKKICDKSIYKLISITRNKKTLSLTNKIFKIDDFNFIIPNLYLGNIKSASNLNFLQDKKIEAIVNCTEKEEFSEYFNDKLKFRLTINDSKNTDNINKFKEEIINSINFIDTCINENKCVYVHCYWGLMRSATVVAAFLMKKYNINHKEAIKIIKNQRPSAIASYYNFNEVLIYVENFLKNKN